MQLLNLEGVVAKRKESIYKPGKKSRDWLIVNVKQKTVKAKAKPKQKIPDIYFAVMNEIKRSRERRLKQGKQVT